MRLPFWDRVKQAMCRWFGHREEYDGDNSRSYSCKRCHLLLRGPLG